MKDDFFDLKGKVIIITGGIGLIGKGYVMACANYGARVIIADVDDKKGNSFIEQVKETTGNKNVYFIKCSIVEKEDLIKLVKFTVDKFGRIDGLVNNAYPKNEKYGRNFEEVTYEDFCVNVDLHLGGYFLTTQVIAQQMVKQKFGVIINMCSIYGITAPRFEIYAGTKMTSPIEYSAIKGGILSITRYLASYLGKHNVRVNCISPGGIFDNQNDKFVKKYSQKVLLGRQMAEVNDLTGVLIFLLSDASKYVTGQNIVVDGGWSV